MFIIFVEIFIVESKIKEVIMPGGDRTGPQGTGPMTGRKMGYCTGDENPDYGFRGGFGRRARRGGFGRGFGRGFGFRGGNFPAAHADEKGFIESEMESLKNQISFLEERLKKIKDKE